MKPILPGLRRAETPEEIYRARYIIALTVTLGAVLELVDTSIVIVAMPHMMGSLGATLDEVAWVTTGYVVANVIVIPIASWLANWFGRRNYVAMSIMLFTFASFMCGSATSLESLVFWRIVQGLGGGGLISTSQAVLYETFPAREAGTSMAIFGLGVMTGPMIGPTLGGYLTDVASWPWIFYVNIPLGIIALLLTLSYVPDSRFGSKAEKVDFIGLLLLAIGVGCLQTMLERGEKLDWWASREILAYAILATGCLAAFIRHELRQDHPIVDLSVVRDPQFAVALLLSFTNGLMMLNVIFLFAIYVQIVGGMSAWHAGLVMLPGSIASGITMGVMGRIMPKLKFDLRLLIVAGTLIMGYSMWAHGQFTSESGPGDFFWPVVLRGVGIGLIFIPLNNLALGAIDPTKVAQASGLYNLVRQLGSSVGIALSATFLVHYQHDARAALIAHVSDFSQAAGERLATLKAALMLRGTPEFLAQEQAYAVLDSLLRKQALVLAFERQFIAIGIALVATLPLLLLMKRAHFKRMDAEAAH